MRNELLTAIVLALGGIVRNPSNRNMLLEDWLSIVSGIPIPVTSNVVYNSDDVIYGSDNVIYKV